MTGKIILPQMVLPFLRPAAAWLLCAVLLGAALSSLHAQHRFTRLHSFGATNLAMFAPGHLTAGRDGALCGTTGSSGRTVVRMSQGGSDYTVLCSVPASNGFPIVVLEGTDGALYGTTFAEFGLAGIVFKVNNDGTGFAPVHDFTGTNGDGAGPYSVLVKTSDGAIYGTTDGGGEHNLGTLFKLNPDGTGYQVLTSFQGNVPLNDGRGPNGLIEASDGALYGTTNGEDDNEARPGTVFRMNRDGAGYTVLRHFDLAREENLYGLMEGSDGVLYGLTVDEDWADYATLFKLNKDGTGYAVLHRFEGAAELPASALIEAGDGALYGTTSCGGTGTVFRMNKDGSGLTNIYHFSSPPDWWMPAGVMEGTDGALYGTSWHGGDFDNGTVFTLNKDGTGFRVLASFPEPPGTHWGTLTSPLCEGSDGALYGTELGHWGEPMEAGTVFKLNKDGTDFGVLHRFQSRVGEGQYPSAAALVNAGDGALYGVTLAGGVSVSNGPGTVFQLNRDGAGYSIPYRFQTSSGDGFRPVCLIEGRDGAFYGVTEAGGELGYGTLFRLEMAPNLYNPVWRGNVFSFQFNARSNVVYQPQFTSSLADLPAPSGARQAGSNWTALPSLTGQRGVVTVTDTNLSAAPRFFRVIIP